LVFAFEFVIGEIGVDKEGLKPLAVLFIRRDLENTFVDYYLVLDDLIS